MTNKFLNTHVREYLKYLTLFTVVILIAAFFFWWLAPEEIVTAALFYIIPFFYIVSLIVYAVLVQASSKRFVHFNNRYMLSTVIKLLLFMVIMIAYVFANQGDAVNFLVTFLILYLLYTAIEVVFIVRATRRIKSDEDKSS
ncbi:MAG: hypothetical protein R6T91_03925 [Bacteroidales bacterium]